MLKRFIISLCAIPLLINLSFGQEEGLTDFLQSFQTFQENNPTEKIFLHLDKTEYAQAETIWIKSYLLAGAGHLPSPFSKTLYVELINEEGGLSERLTLRSEEGFSKASLLIPRDLPQGDYYLRAYTNWMKNQPQEFFFNKKIRIHSIEPGELITPDSKDFNPELKFYPEGGHLVSEVPSRLAFELTGVNMKKDEVYSGKIFDQAGNEVSTFSTSHEGRGMTSFLPRENGYYALLDGFPERFELPAVQPEGIVMSVNNKNENFVTVTLKSSQASETVYSIIAHTRGYITYASQVRLTGTRGFSKIDKNTLPEGITHLTLLGGDMKPLAERLVFIDKDQGLNIQVTPDKESYGTRELVTVGLKVTNHEGKPVQGSFSLSAFNTSLAQNDQMDYNIRTNLLLTSDLAGHIKDPSQYFIGDDEADKNLDLLIMVNGWSRFEWSALEQAETNDKYPVEIGLSLSGRLLKNNGGAAKEGKILLVNATENANNAPYAFADEDGSFSFQNLNYQDTTLLSFQGFQRAGMKNVKFELDSSVDFPPFKNFYESNSVFNNPLRVDAFKKYAKTALVIDSTYRRVNGITYLGDVTVVADKRREKYRVLQSKYGEGESYVNFDEIPYEQKAGRNPYTLMQGRVPGFTLVTLRPSGQGSTSRSGDSARVDIQAIQNDPLYRMPQLRQGAFIGSPLVYLDNVEVGWDQIYQLQATDIDYVEVYKSGSAAVFGTRGFNGAIAIYTLKGKKYFDNLPKQGMLLTEFMGYHSPREFYAPRYDNRSRQRYIPDERATVFWAPMITTDEDGEAIIDFYTPDQSSYVTIDLQGISLTGTTGFGSSGFSIRSDL
jgi:hypothetical protein